MSDSITFDDETPRNTQFGDTYFAKNNGRAETQHVFLGANNLPERWAPSEKPFVIAELGFGTGLNFFETAHIWQAHGAQQPLQFISFEAFPMPAKDLIKSLSPWPEFDEAAAWLAQYWPLDEGWHTLNWRGAQLQLAIGDARSQIDKIEMPVDAWFLDGFAPSRNPELWEEALLQKVFDLTASGGSFATYTAAGWVRRSLQSAGFKVEKFPGFGTKREMMHGSKP